LLEYFVILPFSLEADEQAGHLMASPLKKGTPIGDVDAMIASVALVNGETILTNNVKHFKKANVPVETWSS